MTDHITGLGISVRMMIYIMLALVILFLAVDIITMIFRETLLKYAETI
jgi:hypothetical protein